MAEIPASLSLWGAALGACFSCLPESCLPESCLPRMTFGLSLTFMCSFPLPACLAPSLSSGESPGVTSPSRCSAQSPVSGSAPGRSQAEATSSRYARCRELNVPPNDMPTFESPQSGNVTLFGKRGFANVIKLIILT